MFSIFRIEWHLHWIYFLRFCFLYMKKSVNILIPCGFSAKGLLLKSTMLRPMKATFETEANN